MCIVRPLLGKAAHIYIRDTSPSRVYNVRTNETERAINRDAHKYMYIYIVVSHVDVEHGHVFVLK